MSKEFSNTSPPNEPTDEQARRVVKGVYAALRGGLPPNLLAVLHQTIDRMESSQLAPITFDKFEFRDFAAKRSHELVGVVTLIEGNGSPSQQRVTLIRMRDVLALRFAAEHASDSQPDRLVVGPKRVTQFAGSKTEKFRCRKITPVRLAPSDGGQQTEPNRSRQHELSGHSLAAHAAPSGSELAISVDQEDESTSLVVVMYVDSDTESVFARVTLTRQAASGAPISTTGIIELRADPKSKARLVGKFDITKIAESLDGQIEATIEPISAKDLPSLARSELNPESQTVAFLGAHEELVSIALQPDGDKYIIAPALEDQQRVLDAALSDSNSLFMVEFAPTERNHI